MLAVSILYTQSDGHRSLGDPTQEKIAVSGFLMNNALLSFVHSSMVSTTTSSSTSSSSSSLSSSSSSSSL